MIFAVVCLVLLCGYLFVSAAKTGHRASQQFDEIARLKEQNLRLSDEIQILKSARTLSTAPGQTVATAQEIFQDSIKKLQDKCHAYEQKIIMLVGTHAREIKEARLDANATARSIIKGHLAEEICPFLPGFQYKISDLRMLSHPVDFLVFQGMSENKVESVVFLEIKSGGSVLSERQKQVKDAVENGRVFWDTFKIN